jgi:hypothetical protein
MSLVLMTKNRSYELRLFGMILFKTLILLSLMVFYQLHLAPDEAQYWTWSRKLDWGYYSKPPGIAWQIALTTWLFGNAEWAIRAGALFIGGALTIVIFQFAKSISLPEKTAFWAAVIFAASPLGFFLSFAATTDGGATLFFTLAIFTLAKGLYEKKAPSYGLIGFWVFLGALFKWVSYVFWPILFLLLPVFPLLRQKTLVFGILVSLCALLPSIFWNATHEWATFRHVGSTLSGKVGTGNSIDFFGAQIGLLSPIYFGLLLVGLFFLFRHFKTENRGLIISGITTSCVVFYLAASLFKKMQPNWTVYLYPSGLLIPAWLSWHQLRRGKFWLLLGTALSIFLIGGAISIPWLQSHGVFSLPYKTNPFRQNMGWQHLPVALQHVGYQPEKDFLFGDKYQTASLLSYYAPERKQAYFFNLNFQRKNQFSYWPGMSEKEKNNNGFFAVIENTTLQSTSWYENNYLEKLKPYFASVHYQGAFPLFFANGVGVKYVMIFKCQRYNGLTPKEPDLY